MQEPQLTPSQAARRFADENGFKIVTIGRRYQATHSTGVSFERGGYIALLNEMRAVIGCIENGNAHPVHGFAIDADTPVGGIPDECVASGASCSYAPDGINGEMQCRYCGKEKPVEMCAGGTLISSVVPANWARKTADEIKADIVAGVKMLTRQSRDYNDLEYGTGTTLDAVAKRTGHDERAAGMSDREYRNLLIYGDSRGMPGVDFNEFNAASKARIRRAARKLLGKPPGGPWRITYVSNAFGIASRVDYRTKGFPSRAAALAKVRWLLSDRLTHSWWKRAAVTVEYRA